MNKLGFYIGFLIITCVPLLTSAQSGVSQTLSISPTLLEMQAERGQTWQSEIRVINVNDYDLVVYPQVVNFAPLGEDGRGDLLPLSEGDNGGLTLAEWITVPSDPVIIKAEQTATVPVQISVPDDASPGGHYAAILIGTKPPTSDGNASKVQTAQFVTSLLFVRVAGDVIEEGNIREFTTKNLITQQPTASLEMRFENTGNVHIQPQGDIKIYNMWGEERGMIPINHETHFGNVLPKSIRKFNFTWTGETALYDIGRYKAVATLGYGDGAKQFVTSTTYFWVVPYMTIAGTLLVLFIALKVALWLIRRYVQRMLLLSGVPIDQAPYVPRHSRVATVNNKTVVVKRNYQTVSAPVRAGLREIVTSWVNNHSLRTKLSALLSLAKQYYLVFVAIATAVIIGTIIYLLYSSLTTTQTQYQVAINTPGADVVYSSEEIAYNERVKSINLPTEYIVTPRIDVVNGSGLVGAGAEVRLKLEQAGYKITDLTTDSSRSDQSTIVVYSQKDQELALELSKLLTGALLSARVDESEDSIVIYAGRDTVVK